MTGFRTAERRKAHLRLGIAGPSGSGKTASALLVAYGLCGDWSKIGLVDTENGSGELYVGATIGSTKIGDYQVLTLTAPYEPQKYIQAIRDAEQAGLEVVIVDSLSHAWAGEGGLLDQHGKIADRGGNSFTAWRQVTPLHNQLVEAMLQAGIHIIATLRSKTEYVVQADEKGKSTPKKIGLAPVQREGMEYEFTVFLDLDQKHVAFASKDRTNLLDGRYFTPTVETGLTLKAWLEQGTGGNVEAVKADLPLAADADAPVSSEQIEALVKLAKERGLANRTVSNIIHDRYGKHSSLSLTAVEAEDLRQHMLTLSAKEAS